jgi:hypothetical protein
MTGVLHEEEKVQKAQRGGHMKTGAERWDLY